MDCEPRQLTREQLQLFQDFEKIISETITLRFDNAVAKKAFRRTQEKYALSRNRLDRIVSSLPVPLFSVDRFGYIKTWNRASVDTFGYTPQEILGRSITECLAPGQSQAQIQHLIDRVYNRRRIPGVDLMLKSKHGIHSIMESRIFPHFDAQGEVESCVFITKSRSKIAKTEKALSRTKADYREIASEIMQLKSAFLSNMSHEIRTPLTSIIGVADILGHQTDDTNREFAHVIEESAQQLMDTLGAVLDLTQLENHSLELDPEPLELTNHIDSVMRDYRPLAEEKGIRLTLDRVPEKRCIAYLDRSAHTRIVHNLLDNALKFTRKGEISVSVRSAEASIELSISDTGIGISKAFLPHIFDEFLQESSGISRSYEGSGLGLAITKRLVELMKGTIDVQSKKGEGSTFTIVYPKYVQKAMAA